MNWIIKQCGSPDQAVALAATERQLLLTKPPGSLGRLESIAIELAAMQGTIAPAVDNVQIAVFAGDHGVVAEGVSAFPQAVTVEMVKNFVRGGAAISVLANQLGAGLTVINAGTVAEQPFAAPVIDRPVAHGTANLATRAAMTGAQLQQAMALGRDTVDGFDPHTELVIGGEMGIGNTTSATALAARLSGNDVASLVGPGTGLDAVGVSHKQTVIEKALLRCRGIEQPIELLAELGGFEIAALTGFYIRSGQRGLSVLIDGFISSAAALCACRINPSVRAWMMFSHTSAEPGHAGILRAMNAEPIFDLGLRLGEGSGAAVAVHILRSACALQNHMATFTEAGVSDKE